MIKVHSWHVKDQFTRDFVLMSSGDDIPEFKLGETHLKVPACFEYQEDLPNESEELILGLSFDYFNWLHKNFITPVEVSEWCRENKVHSSQSVGDIVHLEGKGYWIVMPNGWHKLDIEEKDDGSSTESQK